MSITSILNDKELSNSQKLNQVAEIVASARNNYGNAEVKIDPRDIHTVHGIVSFEHLEDEAKVQLLRDETYALKAEAIELSREVSGINVNKKIEELISTSDVFTNISSGTKFEYI